MPSKSTASRHELELIADRVLSRASLFRHSSRRYLRDAPLASVRGCVRAGATRLSVRAVAEV